MTTAEAALGDGKLVTYPSGRIPLIVCGGIAAVLGLDVIGIEIFPIDVIGPHGLIHITLPEVPGFETPGYEAPDMPQIDILQSVQVTPEELAEIQDTLYGKGILTGNESGLVVVESGTLAELMGTIDHIHKLTAQGLSEEEAINLALKVARPDVANAIREFPSILGSSTVITDKGVTGAVKILPNGDVVLY